MTVNLLPTRSHQHLSIPLPLPLLLTPPSTYIERTLTLKTSPAAQYSTLDSPRRPSIQSPLCPTRKPHPSIHLVNPKPQTPKAATVQIFDHEYTARQRTYHRDSLFSSLPYLFPLKSRAYMIYQSTRPTAPKYMHHYQLSCAHKALTQLSQ
jgi:hypothetical protein